MAGRSLFGFQSTQADYWLPVKPVVAAPSGQSAVCERCGAELLVESRFCHRCGQSRARPGEGEASNLHRSVTEQIAPAMAFMVGLACVVGALATGWVQAQSSWQA